jgi:hypothetical protein
MRQTFIAATGFAVFVLMACAALVLGRAAPVYGADPAKPYLGMSQDEIVACAGEPHSRFKSGSDKETLTYHYSGDGPVPGEPGEKKKKDKISFFDADKKKKGGKDWTCSASLVFESGRLIRVSFAHKDVRSPYDWQKEKDPKKQEEARNKPLPTCTFSLPNCARQ